MFTLIFPKKGMAIYDPLSVPNNKFGIHIIDENDLVQAAHLLNSSGGDWGYITMVIPESERIISKWSAVFENLSKYHLIPIIRIATKVEGSYWKAPETEEINNWIEFLNGLPWPVKNRYVIIFNEPNHAKEWGGKLDPENYSEILYSYSVRLKEKSDDFYILPAGLDASAPNSRNTMDEKEFIGKMILNRKNIFDYIDGWTSHSYPNPDFTGKVTDFGRGTLSNYKWEIGFLKSLGINKYLPVFITETGWPHNMDIKENYNYLSPDEVAQNMILASDNVWNDDSIVAVSPFLLNYQSYPFANFSWRKLNSEDFYPQYDAYRSVAKVNGNPILNKSLPTVTPQLSIEFVKGINTINSVNSKNNIFSSIWSFFMKLIG